MDPTPAEQHLWTKNGGAPSLQKCNLRHRQRLFSPGRLFKVGLRLKCSSGGKCSDPPDFPGKMSFVGMD